MHQATFRGLDRPHGKRGLCVPLGASFPLRALGSHPQLQLQDGFFRSPKTALTVRPELLKEIPFSGIFPTPSKLRVRGLECSSPFSRSAESSSDASSESRQVAQR